MTAQIADELGRIPMSQRLGVTLRRATDYASAQNHAEVTLEHLLLALTEDVDAEGVLTSSGVPIASLKSDASQHIANLEQRGAGGSADAISISADLRRILEAAAAAARGRRNAINGAIVLAAIVGDGSSAAAHILSAHGMTFEHAIRALQHQPAAPAEQEAERDHRQQNSPAPPAHREPLGPNGNDAILAEARERVKQRSAHSAPPRRPPSAAPHSDPDGFAAERAAQAAPAPQPVVRDRNEPPTAGRAPQATVRTQPLVQVREQTGAPPPPPSVPPQPHPDPAPVASPPDRGPDRTPESWAPPPAPPRGAPPAPRPYRPPPPIAPEPSPQLRPHPPQFGQGGQHLESRPASPHTPPQPHPGFAGAPQQRTQPGNQAGAPPWADPGDALQPPAQSRQSAPGRQAAQAAQAHGRSATGGPSPAPQRKRAKSGRTQQGQLVENIPRRMRVGIQATAEVRIAKADVKALAEGLEGGGAAYQHELQITKAMSVRLRAPDGGFFIETASPETQWIENALGLMADDYASWRWNVTPKLRGRKRLQLVISARTMGSDGVTAETALPDQVVDVSVSTNYARSAVRTLGWVTAAVIGGLFARFGEQMWDTAQVLAKTLSGP